MSNKPGVIPATRDDDNDEFTPPEDSYGVPFAARYAGACGKRAVSARCAVCPRFGLELQLINPAVRRPPSAATDNSITFA
ncbi:hypothetical protein EVAR_10632_1 [Eumeta japonica]|uniref:Uncharacterized protein n=1 Tax=Eumeta variegata TaxID=151549 RepID=A0A4C1U2J8_EUMVA|nr:hypothetical protein EVAR_10632_1 [Eumeta japonica]